MKSSDMYTAQTYSYSFPTAIRFGRGVISELSPYLINEGASCPLLVTDPNVAGLDFFKKIIHSLKSRKLSPEVFSAIHKNPVKSDVLKGKEAYTLLKRDAVVGIGGGAAMDVARAIALSVNHPRDLFDYDDIQGGSKFITGIIPLFVTVPTTSGTGSEVGRSAIIADDETKKKRILFHPKLMAKMVFADPELTFGLPPLITAATGMDALTHNMEAFLARGFNPLCDGVALEGIRLIAESLDVAVNKPDPASRGKMMIASLMGAAAFQKGLGVVHSMAHPLSALLDMHHGLANAICIPFGLSYNIPGQEEKFKRMAAAMQLNKTDALSLIDALFKLTAKIGLPRKLSDTGVSKKHIIPLSRLAIDDFCHPFNPRKVKLNDFKNLYTEAL